MKGPTYYAPTGGLPPQTQLLTGRAVFTEAYAVVPRGVYSDIVTSYLPFWDKTRLWVIARPLSGFAETFSQYGNRSIALGFPLSAAKSSFIVSVLGTDVARASGARYPRAGRTKRPHGSSHIE